MTIHRGNERLKLLHELGVKVEVDLLLAVAPRLGGIWVHLDEQAVDVQRHGRLAELDDEVGAPAALARIDDDRQVRLLLHDGDGAQVERVARIGLEGANAALAQEHVGVAVREHVLGRQQPFLDLHGHAALEQHRLAAAGRLGDEGEILRVARADLQDVGVLGDQVHVTLGEHLGHDAEVIFLRSLLQELEPFLGQALEFIRRGAGLERAAAQEGRTLCLDRLGRGHELLLALDRAGAGHEAQRLPGADFLAADRDDRILALLRLAADQLVALLHAMDVLNLRPGGQRLERLVRILVANGRNDGLDLAMDGPRLVTELGHLGNDLFDLFQRQVGL